MIGNDQRAVWSWRPQAKSPPISCSITSLCSASAAPPPVQGYHLQRGATLIILLAVGGKSGARSTPLQIRLPALQRCRLNTSYTPFEAVRALEQALLSTIEANRKGNLKNERTYLLE